MARRSKTAALTTSAKKDGLVVIVYGLDEQSKSRAGSFASSAIAAEVELGQFKRAELDAVAWRPLLAGVPAGVLGEGGKLILEQVESGLIDRISAAIETKVGADAVVQPGDEGSQTSSSADPWQQVGVGAVVLVQETPKDGWWEAVVTKVEGEELSLRWRDYSGFPVVRRHRSQIALLNAPSAAPATGSAT